MKNHTSMIKTCASYVASFSLILILLVLNIDIHCFDRYFYMDQYQKLETAANLGMSQEDLMKSTEVLLDYLQEKRDDIDVEVSVNGSIEEAFNQREALHMVDVRNLYQFALLLEGICFIALIISIIVLFFCSKKDMLIPFSIAFIKLSIVLAMFVIMLAIWAYVDFNSFWTTFHRICFRNDLWLLNPATDLMINLFPAQLFSTLVFKIVAGFALPFVGLMAFSYFYLKHKMQENKGEL